MSDVDHIILLVNTITHTRVLDPTYDFNNVITIPFLTHWTYSHMDVAFSNHMQFLK